MQDFLGSAGPGDLRQCAPCWCKWLGLLAAAYLCFKHALGQGKGIMGFMGSAGCSDMVQSALCL